MHSPAFSVVVSLLALIASLWISEDSPAEESRPRLLVLTDIGGDPDDQQSLIRLMLYSNQFTIEGLIASAAGTPGELKEATVKPQLIREIVHAYGVVRDKLASHMTGFPIEAELAARIKAGNPQRGLKAVGENQDTEGSRWIITTADQEDERPLNIAIWGGQTDLAQALWRVRNDRPSDGLATFLKKLRVYDISDQDGIQPWIQENFPDLFYVLAKAAPGQDKREGAYRGMYLDGDEKLTSREWLNEHVRKNHGPLGALYPAETWTAPNPFGALKEGDTPSWFFFLPHGLNDPAHPEWGGWGGRFVPTERRLYRDASDESSKTSSARNTVSRWRPAFQADFQARMDWCVQPRDKANHAPIVAVNGDRTQKVLTLQGAAGAALALDASGSADPDGDKLSYEWFFYPEAGSYRGDAKLADALTAKACLLIPADAAGKTIHVILAVRDSGLPLLVSYRRVIVEAQQKMADIRQPEFAKLTLMDKYYCDGIAAGDINHDGKPDIVAGPFWYEGPIFKARHEFYPALEFPPAASPTDSMFSYVYDFSGDGWLDILVLGRVHLHEAAWYENPGAKSTPWKKHFAFERIRGESPPFLDVDGDGRPELVAHWDDQWGFVQPNWSEPRAPWRFYPITRKGQWDQFYHGTGVGDVNGDGRQDLVLNEGWYEQPAERGDAWKRHEFRFGERGGAQIFVYDVNEDGRNDVITALDAHGWGLAWFENIASAEGLTFMRRTIMSDRDQEAELGAAFSQPHAMALADMNGDGRKDLVTGKRRWAHGPHGDIEPNAAPVLYWFELTHPHPGQVRFLPHRIDDDSGVGVQITVTDINADARPDVLTVSKLGAFAFLNQLDMKGRVAPE